MRLNVESFSPRHPLLRRHIDYYYFLQHPGTDFFSRYYVFPHYTLPLSIHRRAEAIFHPGHTEIKGGAGKEHTMVLQGMRNEPLLATLSGSMDKITILFRPLGLNHFIDGSFLSVAPGASQLFDAFGEDASAYLDRFFATDDRNRRIDIIEELLLSRYRPIPALEKWESLLPAFFDREKEGLETIADQLNMSYKTFGRRFKELLGTSPASYMKIIRFRQSLQNKIIGDRFKKLVEVAYESNYTDQAYFNKIYKHMTQQAPGKFFRNIERNDNDKFIYRPAP
jgi:AraC-like DNA-binding protein